MRLTSSALTKTRTGASSILLIAFKRCLTCLRVSRVQNASNTITWQFSSGDPSPIDILVVNANNATLNGAFSIARFVNVSDQVRTLCGVIMCSSLILCRRLSLCEYLLLLAVPWPLEFRIVARRETYDSTPRSDVRTVARCTLIVAIPPAKVMECS